MKNFLQIKILPLLLCGFVLTVFLSACDFQTSISSGTVEDPYLEEPVPEEYKGYAPYLETSNKLMEKLKNEEYEAFFEHTSPKFQEATSLMGFRNYYSTIQGKFGFLKEYKPQQWSFSHDGNKEMGKLIVCSKLSKHEDSQDNQFVRYHFFYELGNPQMIVTILIEPYEHEVKKL